MVVKNYKKLFYLSAVLSFGMLVGCGSEDDAETTSAVAFSSVSTIIENSCGTASCHASGGLSTEYVDNEANVTEDAATIITRLNATDATVMPPSSASQTLSASDKASLISYLEQY